MYLKFYFHKIENRTSTKFFFLIYKLVLANHTNDLCKKNCSVHIQCKGDNVVVDIKQHKSQFKNSNFTITQSAKFF